ARVARLTDRLGKGIDAGILDTVIALRLSGIHTVSSCEGHLNWGVGAPWVSMAAPPDDRLLRWEDQLSEASGDADDLAAKGGATEAIEAAYRRMHQARLAAKAVHLEVSGRALALLGEYYDLASGPTERRLILTMLGNGRARLQSQGADFQEVRPEDQRAHKLLEYQQEMSAFTAFLKGKLQM